MTAALTPLSELFLALYKTVHQQKAWEVYKQLNLFRDEWNAQQQEFELYLEDQWNEPTSGQTHFEYLLRSRKTLHEIGPLGYDIYTNRQDAGGVWHLGDYQSSCWLLLTEPLCHFDPTGRSFITLTQACEFLKTHQPPLI